VDDSLDVAAVHLGGGVIGSLCVGLFATKAVNGSGADGLFYGGGYHLLGRQAVTVLAVTVYSMVMTYVLAGVINRMLGNRVRAREELIGLDLSQHGESAYEPAPAVPAGHNATPTGDGRPGSHRTGGNR
jgi:Amt family ammonium transporter